MDGLGYGQAWRPAPLGAVAGSMSQAGLTGCPPPFQGPHLVLFRT